MFVPRQPSVQWEQLVPPELPGCQLWGWFFPANAPNSVTVTVPKTTFALFGMYLTARQLIAAVGWPIQSIDSWRLAGATHDAQGGGNPLLDHPLPPMPGLDLEVVITLFPSQLSQAKAAPADLQQNQPPVQAVMSDGTQQVGGDAAPVLASSPSAQSPDNILDGLDEILAAAPSVDSSEVPQAAVQHAPVPSTATPIPHNPGAPQGFVGVDPSQLPPNYPAAPNAGPAVGALATPTSPIGQPAPAAGAPVAVDEQSERLMVAIEADWRAIEQVERQLASVTKQLNGQAAKLQSLNRDLNAHERLAADSNDIKDWTDVRRLLRDGAATISKQVRAFDIGTVSSAGNRNRFQEIYENHIQPRIPFADMAAIAHEFESHRKTCQNLLTQSTAALSASQRDAEGKARAVLNRIGAKARAKR